MSELIKVAIMNLSEAKELQKALLEQNVELVLNHNESTCTRGCSVTVEVHALEKDLPMIQQEYSNRYAKLLEGHDVDLNAINQVFDTSKEKAICPACSFEFSTSESECPDCGLVLG